MGSLRTKQLQLAFSTHVTFKFLPQILLAHLDQITFLNHIWDVPAPPLVLQEVLFQNGTVTTTSSTGGLH